MGVGLIGSVLAQRVISTSLRANGEAQAQQLWGCGKAHVLPTVGWQLGKEKQPHWSCGCCIGW